MALTALALNCTLKPTPDESSTGLLLSQVGDELRTHGVPMETIRVVNFDVRPGTSSDEGQGDEWPTIRERVLAADILVFGTPVWMGAPSSVAKRVAERLDAFLSETDEQGRMPSYGKVAVVAVVGNEDGAHHVSAELYQWLADVGFTIPANAVTYWVGEAMQTTDYKDLDSTPEKTAEATAMAVRNAVHLAGLLAGSPYPGSG
jgi:multimeric flavodoxin WrbA